MDFDPMESFSSQPDSAESLSRLDDAAFLELLTAKDIKLHAEDGQLRVNAVAGALHDELREELKRRKAGLIALLSQGPSSVGNLRRSDLGVRARQRISPAGQWTQHLQYWKTHLEGISGFLELPFSKPRPEAFAAKTSTLPFHLPSKTTVILRNLAMSRETSLETLLAGAFLLLIYRYTGQPDFCVGLPVLRKQRKGDPILEDKIENLIPLRFRLSTSSTFLELLDAVRSSVNEDYSHSTLPLDRLLEMLPIATTPNAHPLFQILFGCDFSNGHGTALIDNGADSLAYDLVIFMDREMSSGLQGHIRYQEELFSADRLSSFVESYIALLESIAASPEERVSKLCILGAERRERMLVDWNRTEMHLPSHASIHGLFERAVELSADSVAVIDGDKTVTYAELNRLANQMAHFLLAKKIPREACLGICMERSVHMIVAMLAVLKAGCAYLPLDPLYPAQRLEAMLADSHAALVITDKKIREVMSINERQIMRVDMDEATISTMPSTNPSAEVEPDDLAYVIYTSGSTGRPKGVAIEHHSTVSLLTWASTVFSADELARVFAATSICFDLSIFEIFLPLSTGGSVILAADFLELPRLGAQTRPSLLNTVPSAMSALLVSEIIPASVRCVCLAGEPLPQSLVDQIRECGANIRVFDLYGPTETTTYSTYALRDRMSLGTIGKPLANTKIFILDAEQQPVPPDVPGQIYIGGEGVAREYLYKPMLTRERFIKVDHLAWTDKLYATGDLGRFRADGNIEYLGRLDSQIKIRGFRVEPGEIEATLQQHPRVRDAAVVLRALPGGTDGLVAFVTMTSAPLHSSDLIDFQQKFLPSHMVVREIVFLEALPLTLNGKIDRNALKQRPVSAPKPDTSTKVLSELEQKLIAIWERNFKLTSIGVDDDFFALGGHSLLAFQIFNEIERHLKISMVLSVLFKAPTVRLLAAEIERKNNLVRGYALH
ncbi:MAG: amino acid adenylation domain-containing protein [Edaphobacter sp.]|uniref:non-ribosomal peptide synthetase n=1 Tax=Edaphobacter sp. TaxID=1934404 RepID=UPI0023871142|nr:amino acid adenylation domain-containing protein [Edaphobacter sp.]MDE1175179.1 amino acid adenylation domain-containing protein [Edaphobacter sp.]